MPLTEKDGLIKWSRRSQAERIKIHTMWIFAAFLFVLAARYISEQTIWIFVLDAPRQAQDFITRMFPPDMRYFNRAFGALWDTLNIAVFGTMIAVVVSIPIAILAAKNTTPHPTLRAAALAIVVGSRSVNSLIWALLIVQITGPGLFAGVLAIAIRSVGMISKLLYESIEEINREPIEATIATGASRAQTLVYAYVPQLMPIFVGITVYRWEINIRESTIIGIVGGGGIGFLLNSAINRLAWNQAVVILITILATVIVAEWVSAKVRAKVT